MDSRTRTRLLILVAFVIIVAAVGVVLLIGMGEEDQTAQTDPAQPATTVPGDTAEPTEVPPTAQPTQEITEIVIAVQPISRGSEIPQDAVRMQPWPLEAAPFEGVESVEDAVGKIARTDIYPEQPILTSMVVDSLEDLAAVGSDAAAVLPAGQVAVSLPMDRLTSVSYALQPGDRVDIIVSLLFIDIDEQFQSALPNNINVFSASREEDSGNINLGTGADLSGRIETRRVPLPLFEGNNFQPIAADIPVIISPSESPRPRLLTQRTIQDAQVIWTGNFPRDGKLFEEVSTPTPVQPTQPPAGQQQGQGEVQPTAPPPRPDIVTLAVSPQEAVMITWMVEARIPITFTLRSAADRSRRPTDPVTLDYIMNQYDITVPPRNEYSIQPAIRSIRQLLVGNTISLSDGGGTGGNNGGN